MIRNLKTLMLAALAVAAFGAFSAVGAQAAPLFNCTPAGGQTGCNLKIEADGTGKTAHHVFEITNSASPVESTSVTCGEIKGTATMGATASSVTSTTIEYPKPVCFFLGSEAEVKMNGCQYKLEASGGVAIVNCGGNQIEIIIPTCVVKIGEQVATGGVSYHNLGTSPNRTVTLQTNPKITVNIASITGTNCGINLTGPYTGHLTTANTIIQATEDPGTNERDGWWTA